MTYRPASRHNIPPPRVKEAAKAGASTSMGASASQGSVEIQFAFFGVPLAGAQEVVFVL